MTLGERIQQARKDKALSQESLGEALGVSRQAVSKWESDVTIPEIDKLIAMSRLFGVSVGALLGVEEDDPSTSAAEELTDRELKAIETIVERYLAKTKKPDNPRFRLLPIIIGCLAVVFVVIWAKGQLDDLSTRMNALQSDVSTISSRVSAEINSMTDRIQNALEWESSLVSGQDVTVTDVDILNGTLTIDIQATPKAYTEGMDVIFTAEPEGEDPLTIPGELISGHTFRVTDWALPMNDSIQLSVSFGINGEWQTHTLDRLTGYNRDTTLGLEVTRGGRSGLLKHPTNLENSWYIDWTLTGVFYCKSDAALQQGLEPGTPRFVIQRNGLPVVETDMERTTEHNGNWHIELAPTYETPVVSGDTLTYCIDYTDSFGRKYRHFLEEIFFETDQNGNLTHSFVAPIDEMELT